MPLASWTPRAEEGWGGSANSDLGAGAAPVSRGRTCYRIRAGAVSDDMQVPLGDQVGQERLRYRHLGGAGSAVDEGQEHNVPNLDDPAQGQNGEKQVVDDLYRVDPCKQDTTLQLVR